LIDNVVVRSSDIDFYNHTNNISYVRYIVNQYSINTQKQKPISQIEIRYVNQSFEGDTLKIYRCSDNTYTIKSDDKTIVNCLIA
jgi:acyl-ACP thioesterase